MTAAYAAPPPQVTRALSGHERPKRSEAIRSDPKRPDEGGGGALGDVPAVPDARAMPSPGTAPVPAITDGGYRPPERGLTA